MSDDIQSPATADWVNSLNFGSPVSSPTGAFSCTVYGCREVFTRARFREEHIRHDHKPVPQICNLCGTEFPRNAHLKEHIELCHSQGPPFECSSSTNIRSECSCGRHFPSRASLHKHQRSFVVSSPSNPTAATQRDSVVSIQSHDFSSASACKSSAPVAGLKLGQGLKETTWNVPMKRPAPTADLSQERKQPPTIAPARGTYDAPINTISEQVAPKLGEYAFKGQAGSIIRHY